MYDQFDVGYFKTDEFIAYVCLKKIDGNRKKIMTINRSCNIEGGKKGKYHYECFLES